MNFLDYHKINSAYQDSLRRTKAEPLPVKQQDYYDFNTPEQDAASEPNASGKGVLLPFKKNKTNSNTGKKSKKDKKSKKEKKKSQKEELENKKKEKEKKKKISKKALDQESENQQDSAEDKKLSRKKRKEKREKEKREQKEKKEKKEKKLEVEVKVEKVEVVEAPKVEVKVSIPLKEFNFTTRNKPSFDFKYFDFIGVDKTNYTTSIFKNHELKRFSSGPINRESHSQDWVLIVILFSLLSISWLKVFHYKKLNQYFNIFLKERISGQVLREERPFSEQASIQMFVSGLFSLSLYFFQVITSSHLNVQASQDNGGMLYVKILCFLLVLFSVKILSLKLLGHIFLLQKMATEYIYTILLFFNILGVLVLPLTIALQYVPVYTSLYFICFGAVLIALVFLYGLYRGLIIGIGNSTVSNFYLFIYLCTLEILPLLIVFNLILNNLNRLFP